MVPLGTFGANHEIVRALNQHGVRYLVVGGTATSLYAPQRTTEHVGELDLLIDPTLENAEKAVAALYGIGRPPAGWDAQRLAGPWRQIKLDDGSLYADIVTPHEEEDFAGYWERALDERIGGMPVKVISCEDQLALLSRSPLEKHKRDVELLTSVCGSHRGQKNAASKERGR